MDERLKYLSGGFSPVTNPNIGDAEFGEYRRLILHELERLNSQINTTQGKIETLVMQVSGILRMESEVKAQEDRIRKLENELSKMQERIAVYVTLGSAVVGVAVSVIMKFLNFGG